MSLESKFISEYKLEIRQELYFLTQQEDCSSHKQFSCFTTLIIQHFQILPYTQIKYRFLKKYILVSPANLRVLVLI